MNKYGTIAQAHWKKVAPARYEELESPETFFTELGEQAQVQIEAILDRTERTVNPDLPYLEKVGTLNALRKQAEEITLTDLVYTIPIEYSLTEELDQMLGGLPDETLLKDALRQLTNEAEEEDWTESGWTERGWTEEMETERDQLTALLPLVTEQNGRRRHDLDLLTEAETRDWILKLLPFWDPETQTLVRVR